MRIKLFLKSKLLLLLTKKKNTQFDLKNAQSILMLRYDRIGDMVVTTPVFRELRRAYPNIEINILASKENEIILKNNPNINNVYINNKNNFFGDLPLLLKLRRKKIDVCIEFDHSVVPHAILRLNIIRPKKTISVQKAGRYGVKGENLKIYDYYTKKSKNAHFKDIWLNTLNPLEVIPNSSKYDIFLDIQRKNKALNFVKSFSNKILCGINLEGNVKGKKIRFEQLYEICLGLKQIEDDIKIIILSKPSREKIIDKYIFQMGLDYVEKTFLTIDILDVSAIISYLDIVITPDTSITHIASTYNKPIITIHENNIDSFRLFSPTSENSRTVFSKSRNSLEGYSVISLLTYSDELITDIKKQKKLN